MKKKFLYGFVLLFVFFAMSPAFAKELGIEKINQVSVGNDGYWMAPFANTYKTSDGGYVVAQENYVYYIDKNNNIKWDYNVGGVPGGAYDILLDGNYVYVTVGEECHYEAIVNSPKEGAIPIEMEGKSGPIAGSPAKPDKIDGDVPHDDKPVKGDRKDGLSLSMFYTVKLNLSNGNVVKETNEIAGTHIEKVGNNYAVTAYTSVILMDSNLNIVKTYDNGICMSSVTVEKEQIYAIESDNKLLVFDSSLNLKSTKNVTGDDLEWDLNFNETRSFFVKGNNAYLPNFDIASIDSTGHYAFVVPHNTNSSTSTNYFSGFATTDYFIIGGLTCPSLADTLDLYNDDYNEVEGAGSAGNCRVFVNVYDSNFNVVKTVTVGTGYELYLKNVAKTDAGFTVKWIDTDNDTLYVTDYAIKYDITTEVQGKGSIEVIDTAFPGDPVRFKVTPEPGYVVMRVTVTDTEGNSVVYEDADSDYIFTMPSSDAKVSVLFMKNPLTASNISIMVIVVAIITGITIFVKRKKKVNA